ncbi:MAG TPA: hypothetical protein VEG40_09195 [Gaiellaceae bacterium]|nr:hypothetical protein [Gaiellaceae bacterium]
MEQSSRPGRRIGVRGSGAYGLRLLGLEEAAHLLVPAAPEWPTLAVESRVSAGLPLAPDVIGPDAASIRLRGGGRVEISRDRAIFYAARPLDPVEVVHPYLAPVAAVVGHWLGRESLHAGAAVVRGRAWALLGDRESGKSSTLAALAAAGHGVLCDDVLVLDRLRPLSGPRTLDLREDAAARLDLPSTLQPSDTRSRHRVELPPAPDELVLGGSIFLEWNAEEELRELRPTETVGRLSSARVLRIPPATPELLLELAAVPAWVVRRPRSWFSLDRTVELIERIAAT